MPVATNFGCHNAVAGGMCCQITGRQTTAIFWLKIGEYLLHKIGWRVVGKEEQGGGKEDGASKERLGCPPNPDSSAWLSADLHQLLSWHSSKLSHSGCWVYIRARE